MSIEVEIKAWLTDYEATRRAVEAAGAESLGETEKRDLYYGPAGRAARDIDLDRDRVFRIRSELHRHVVTAKERGGGDGDGVEVNREVEFEIVDVAAFRQFARLMGFRPFIVKRKKTRKYALEGAAVELHHVDPLGDFIEIEVLIEDASGAKEAEARVRGLLERFGVPAAKIEPRRYIDLLRRIGVGRPDRGE